MFFRNQNSFAITIRKFGVRLSFPDYNCENDADVIIEAGETKELVMDFKPLPRDVSKAIQVSLRLRI